MTRAGAVAVAAALTAVLAAGCTQRVEGIAHGAAGIKPTPVGAAAVGKVLLDAGELGRELHQSFEGGQRNWSGGIDDLPDSDGTPADCAGIAQQWAARDFQEADAGDFMQRTFRNTTAYSADPVVIGVQLSVMALPDAPAADTAFDRFAAQWKHCSDTTIRLASSGFTSKLTDVQVADSVLSAEDHVTGAVVVHHGRAIGVRVNCLVQADVAFFGDAVGQSVARKSPERKTAATDLVRLMMDRVSEFS